MYDIILTDGQLVGSVDDMGVVSLANGERVGRFNGSDALDTSENKIGYFGQQDNAVLDSNGQRIGVAGLDGKAYDLNNELVATASPGPPAWPAAVGAAYWLFIHPRL